jgi:hypothetical protein
MAELTKREPDKDMPLGFNIEVTLFRDGQRVASYSFLPSRLGSTRFPVNGPVRSYDIHARGLPKGEAESIGMFIRATEELCRYLLDGGTVGEWFWEPSSDASKVPGRRRKPEWVEINAGQDFFLTRSESYFTKGRNAPSSWVTTQFQDGQSASV